ncbi:hypothetical protein [uncultured Desulfosarcina sp.]|uniref:hypothetical protein n=1 Tax=uncultured Desulfosarcina sp. TaxID=218289 RepID=UPI0029C7B1C8|nr:hypothetical protein [uncultured Desulfosarcina sp.]
MSVVAGCSLFDGVLLTADCRATIRRPYRENIYSDNVLKVIAISPDTAIGFVGDIDVASFLLHRLLIEIRRRKRKDPTNLSLWMPRFFRYYFNQFVSKKGKRTLVFMIASVLRGHRNIVERQAVVELTNRILSGQSSIQRNWIPSFLLDFLKIPPKYKFVEIPGSCRNVLYTLESPEFIKKDFPPLKYTAIGSGDSCLERIDFYHDSIVALDPGNSRIEGAQFRDVIQRFIWEKNIQSVGGLYPVLKISGMGVEHIGMGTEIPIGGTRIELLFRSGRWVQKNESEGKEVTMQMPWEFVKNPIYKNSTFDDLKNTMTAFKAND